MWAFLTSPFVLGFAAGNLSGWLFLRRHEWIGLLLAWLWAQIVYAFGKLRAQLPF